jgi:hypothetical protein
MGVVVKVASDTQHRFSKHVREEITLKVTEWKAMLMLVSMLDIASSRGDGLD